MPRLLLLPFLLVAACAAKQPPENAPVGDQSEPTLGTCEVAKAQFAVGQMADAALVDKVRQATGARVVRQIRPGQMVTMDFSNGRLNLTLDVAGKVTKVTCG